jgi:hypothetical protein
VSFVAVAVAVAVIRTGAVAGPSGVRRALVPVRRGGVRGLMLVIVVVVVIIVVHAIPRSLVRPPVAGITSQPPVFRQRLQ